MALNRKGLFGFALSKLNLLIFVIAVFSIITFFSFQLGKGLTNRYANDLVVSQSRIASDVVNSPNYCSSLQRFIPESFSTLGQSEFLYTMKLSALPASGGSSNVNWLIFSVSERRDPEHIIAASSFQTTSRILFWKENQWRSDDVSLDPQSVPPTNSFYLIKEVLQDPADQTKELATLYVVPCGVSFNSNAVCEQSRAEAGAAARASNPVQSRSGFLC